LTSYNKPHLTYQQQLELLKYRGLVVKDEQFAIIKLQHISYYRLSYECKGKISKKSIPKNFLEEIQKELSRIDKPLIKKIENFISKYPLFSVLVTFVFSTVVNLFSNWLWEFIK